jgi:hypothetical protein
LKKKTSQKEGLVKWFRVYALSLNPVTSKTEGRINLKCRNFFLFSSGRVRERHVGAKIGE